MYSINELSAEERKYLFCRASFADYASQVENFEHTDSLSMLRIAEQRAGATEPGTDDFDRARSTVPKSHWMLSSGACGKKRIDGRFVLSSQDFGKLVRGDNSKAACKYCVSDFLFR